MIIEIEKVIDDELSIKDNKVNLSIGNINNGWNKYQKEHIGCKLFFSNDYGEKKDLFKYGQNSELEDRRDVDQCVLMVQSPCALFCYWDISKRKKKMIEHHLNGEWSSFEKKLRIYDITAIFFNGHNAHRYQDFSFNEASNQCFFDNLLPNRTYCVDVGVVTRESSFFSLLRSNPVDTPRSSQFETGLFTKAVSNWKEGKRDNPEWLEGFSSYSYYEKVK
ncbi:hypothetical protein BKP37_05795 [Anaerobacillus alkalilacustris]|uniref:DUF4912 domain-containing protein n=1 Tax=Anaerobacillus alkalilacustris TaxID=393763 RepID=A0A1S2LYG2_9BACI|nr:DUF4912 domain-containing protein [Anaerobacillus alkalilacustris]OIJ16737.1 hypothetical protein BKP37_05795 [Anaerobacillus alkalilacustris]